MQQKINQFINVLIAECWDEILTDDGFHFTTEEMSDWLWTYEESFNELFNKNHVENKLENSDAISDPNEKVIHYEDAYERITVEAIDLAVAEMDRRVLEIRKTLKGLFDKHTNT
jgi:hypothetical protein